MLTKRSFLMALAFLLVIGAALAACGGPSPDNGGSSTGSNTTEVAVTLSAGGVQDKTYFGVLSAPNKGFTALFIHHDNTADVLVVATNDMTFSAYMTGELKGQTLNVSNEGDTGRGLGRPVGTTGFELNLTYPGAGTLRSEMKESTDGALYRGKLSDLAAGLVVMPDGTVNGIAAVSGGASPTYEYLCAEEGALKGLPDEVTVKTCDSDKEVTLTRIRD